MKLYPVSTRFRRRRHVHVRVAGEKCVVDYAGLTMPVVEVQTGDGRDGQFFGGALGASHVIYSEAHVRSALKGRYTTEPTHRHPRQSYRACLGLLALQRRYAAPCLV